MPAGTANVISEMSICNMALTRLGGSQTISSFADGSNEANQCAIWYPQDRDATLSEFPWPWAEVFAQLAEVAGPETTQARANAVWWRSFTYPTDCLMLRRIVRTPSTVAGFTAGTTAYVPNEPWRRAVGDAEPISYSLSNNSAGRLITTDAYGANGLTVVYTQKVSDPTQFAADFVDILAWRLAGDLAMALGRDDAKRKFAFQMYEELKGRARASHVNQTQSDIPHVGWQSESVRARWGRRSAR